MSVLVELMQPSALVLALRPGVAAQISSAVVGGGGGGSKLFCGETVYQRSQREVMLLGQGSPPELGHLQLPPALGTTPQHPIQVLQDAVYGALVQHRLRASGSGAASDG